VPWRPVTAAGGDALRDGVALTEGAGGVTVVVTVGVTVGVTAGVTPGETETAAGGDAGCAQAARASSPSNAGRVRP
jgi:hypothetical protein